METEKSGMFKKNEVDMYLLTASFIPTEKESKIFLEHPLFKHLVFMEYNEVDKWVSGIIFKDKHQADRIKQISVNSIFANSDYTFRAYSIKRILELRELVITAVENFVKTVDVLEKLEGTEQIDVTIESLNDSES
jgi:hypothetical protein